MNYVWILWVRERKSGGKFIESVFADKVKAEASLRYFREEQENGKRTAFAYSIEMQELTQ
jgi:hypothetical protein